MKSFQWINNDGEQDSIDPVIEHREEEDSHIIDNGYYEYEVMKSNIKRWWFEELPEEQ